MKTTILIFGITGDLSVRKLLPSLGKIIGTGDFDDVQIVGVSRHQVDVENLLHTALGDTTLNDQVEVITMNIAVSEDYVRLKQRLAIGDEDQLLIYLAVPPQASGQIIRLLGETGFAAMNTKLLLEKPFGLDLETAKDMSQRLNQYFREERIYRIDHYLAKQMAQNIVTFRTQNAMFSHLWSNTYIEKIEVFAFEAIGIEGRAQFYEQTGAIRDFLQGHLLQLLALAIMDGRQLDMDNLLQIADRRLAALEALIPAEPARAYRGQYNGYRQEVGVEQSCVETFVSICLESRDERWQGVPLILATGKALDQKLSQVRVHFKKTRQSQANCLTFNIQPHEGVDIALIVGSAGYEYTYDSKHLAFRYPEDVELPDAYEQVMVDAIRDRRNIFPTGDEIIRSWQLLQPLLDHWAMCDPAAITIYDKGLPYETVLAQAMAEKR